MRLPLHETISIYINPFFGAEEFLKGLSQMPNYLIPLGSPIEVYALLPGVCTIM